MCFFLTLVTEFARFHSQTEEICLFSFWYAVYQWADADVGQRKEIRPTGQQARWQKSFKEFL